jgi:hypothetical protein
MIGLREEGAAQLLSYSGTGLATEDLERAATSLSNLAGIWKSGGNQGEKNWCF